MKTLSQRTQEALDAGFTVGQLAEAAKVSSSAVSQWLSGGSRSLKGATAAGLAKLTGWSATWWITGEGPREQATPPPYGRAVSGPIDSHEPGPYGLPLREALETLGAALALPLDPAVRTDVADALHKLAMRGGAARDQRVILSLLSELPAKRLATG